MKLSVRRAVASRTHLIIRIVLGVLITLLFVVNEIFGFRWLQQLEHFAYDSRIRLFAKNTPDPRVVIIDLDERSLLAEGRWPWPRNKVANMVQALFDKYQISVLGFDVVFAEPDVSSGLPVLEQLAKDDFANISDYQQALQRLRPKLNYDGLLAEQFSKYPVVLGFATGDKSVRIGALPRPALQGKDMRLDLLGRHEAAGFSGNLPALQEAAPAGGHFYPVLDIDGVVRRVPMFILIDDGLYEALSLALARLALDNPPLRAKVSETGSKRTIDFLEVGDRRIPLDSTMAALVPYRGTRQSFPYVSATDVLNGRVNPALLKGRIAIVGTSAQGLLDLRSTPVAADYPGVEIHANLVAGILDGSIKSEPFEALGANTITVLLAGLLLAILIPLLTPTWATGAALAALATVLAFNIFMWARVGVVLALAGPLALILTLYFMNMAYGFFTESRSKRLITARFGEYIPRELVDEMAKDPEAASMEGESREMTVLFSDVRNFTTISEGLSASELSKLMNAYLTPMTEVIQGERGTIDKYIGDAIMCFWGAPLKDPDHAKRGVAAALAMQRRVRELWPEFEARGWPKLEIGVGLSTGEMRVGNMGSRFRRAYTVMGDTVNLGARLEGTTKEYGVGILVSEAVVKSAPQVVYRELDRIRVKGKLEPVSIFEPVGLGGEVETQVLDSIDLFHRALDRYREQRWDDAEMLLTRVLRAAPDLKVVKVYQERIAHFRRNPPGAQWDGVWTFKTK
jgi:adenylate cyclase